MRRSCSCRPIRPRRRTPGLRGVDIWFSRDLRRTKCSTRVIVLAAEGNGKWIAYQSNESSKSDVYIVPFPDATIKMQVSKGGGWDPRWSSDGRELYYLGDNKTIIAATLLPRKNGLQIAESRPLFKIESPGFDVSQDGKRFLICQDMQNQGPSAVTLISNWTEALR